mgnify:CR=1 FL=1
MKKYTGINIGPVVPTITLGRKPREIWSASYLFSFLMESIINEIKKVENIKIISPEVLTEKHIGVGLYPDRVFVQGNFDAQKVVNSALDEFYKTTGISSDYVNVMHVTINGKDANEDNESIKRLNQLLDCTELCNRSTDSMARNKVLELIQKKNDSCLFEQAHNNKNFPIPYLAEIATKRLEKLKADEWTELRDKYKGKDAYLDGDEDAFYQDLKQDFKEKYGEDFYSYYKYICIVQADGDNMGKIVSSVSADKVMEVSKALLKYGKSACEKVKEYGGLPIYAGGDDLLFIAPVRGNDQTIFDLIDKIDKLYADVVDKSIDGFRPDNLHTYLSYGLSISYYKYPLYEAFKAALDLLFDRAKKVKGKNAVSWQLRKHSGSGFKGELSKNNELYATLKDIMKISVDENQISAIAHKLRRNENLLDILLGKFKKDKDTEALEERIENFYKKTMEDTGDDKYTIQTRDLLFKLMKESDEKINIETILENMYGMLRTAKFIKGEGESDE